MRFLCWCSFVRFVAHVLCVSFDCESNRHDDTQCSYFVTDVLCIQDKHDTAHRWYPTETSYLTNIMCYFMFNQAEKMVSVPSHFGSIDTGLQRGRVVIRPGSRIVSSDDSHK